MLSVTRNGQNSNSIPTILADNSTKHKIGMLKIVLNGTVTSTADRLTWKVKTPFGEGAPKKINGIDIADSLDYKWVHFRLNKQSQNKSYYADKRRKYT